MVLNEVKFRREGRATVVISDLGESYDSETTISELLEDGYGMSEDDLEGHDVYANGDPVCPPEMTLGSFDQASIVVLCVPKTKDSI